MAAVGGNQPNPLQLAQSSSQLDPVQMELSEVLSPATSAGKKTAVRITETSSSDQPQPEKFTFDTAAKQALVTAYRENPTSLDYITYILSKKNEETGRGAVHLGSRGAYRFSYKQKITKFEVDPKTNELVATVEHRIFSKRSSSSKPRELIITEEIRTGVPAPKTCDDESQMQAKLAAAALVDAMSQQIYDVLDEDTEKPIRDAAYRTLREIQAEITNRGIGERKPLTVRFTHAPTLNRTTFFGRHIFGTNPTLPFAHLSPIDSATVTLRTKKIIHITKQKIARLHADLKEVPITSKSSVQNKGHDLTSRTEAIRNFEKEFAKLSKAHPEGIPKDKIAALIASLKAKGVSVKECIEVLNRNANNDATALIDARTQLKGLIYGLSKAAENDIQRYKDAIENKRKLELQNPQNLSELEKAQEAVNACKKACDKRRMREEYTRFENRIAILEYLACASHLIESEPGVHQQALQATVDFLKNKLLGQQIEGPFKAFDEKLIAAVGKTEAARIVDSATFQINNQDFRIERQPLLPGSPSGFATAVAKGLQHIPSINPKPTASDIRTAAITYCRTNYQTDATLRSLIQIEARKAAVQTMLTAAIDREYEATIANIELQNPLRPWTKEAAEEIQKATNLAAALKRDINNIPQDDRARNVIIDRYISLMQQGKVDGVLPQLYALGQNYQINIVISDANNRRHDGNSLQPNQGWEGLAKLPRAQGTIYLNCIAHTFFDPIIPVIAPGTVSDLVTHAPDGRSIPGFGFKKIVAGGNCFYDAFARGLQAIPNMPKLSRAELRQRAQEECHKLIHDPVHRQKIRKEIFDTIPDHNTKVTAERDQQLLTLNAIRAQCNAELQTLLPNDPRRTILEEDIAKSDLQIKEVQDKYTRQFIQGADNIRQLQIDFNQIPRTPSEVDAREAAQIALDQLLNSYIHLITEDRVWGTSAEMYALSVGLAVSAQVWNNATNGWIEHGVVNPQRAIYFDHSPGHFDLWVPMPGASAAAARAQAMTAAAVPPPLPSAAALAPIAPAVSPPSPPSPPAMVSGAGAPVVPPRAAAAPPSYALTDAQAANAEDQLETWLQLISNAYQQGQNLSVADEAALTHEMASLPPAVKNYLKNEVDARLIAAAGIGYRLTERLTKIKELLNK